jgi:segregation and condensation protein A
VFEGPLDLLLYLIKRDELDIYDIPIERITQQYMQYLDVMKMLDLSIAGEFLVMAATLMMIKSRMLLPVEDRPELEAEEDDPRWDLVRQLVEYKKFKDAADHLEDAGAAPGGRVHPRRRSRGARAGPEVALHDVSIFDLITAFNEALKRVKKEDLTEIFSDRYTVADKVDFLSNLLRREKTGPLFRHFRRHDASLRDGLHLPGHSGVDPAEAVAGGPVRAIWRHRNPVATEEVRDGVDHV